MRVGLHTGMGDTVGRMIFKTVATKMNARGWEIARSHGLDFPWHEARKGAIDALVTRVSDVDIGTRLAGCTVPVINFSNAWRTPGIFQVMHDNRAIGRLAAGHLQALGYRRAGILSFEQSPFSKERAAGFATAWPGGTVHHYPPLRDLPDLAGFAKLIAGGPPVEAIYAVNDFLAARTLLAAGHLGMRVPDDLAVMGTDHDEVLSLWAGRELTSVVLNYEGHADAIIGMLETIRQNPRAKPQFATVPAMEVFPGETAGRVGPADPRLAAAATLMRSGNLAGIDINRLATASGMSRRTFERVYLRAAGETAGASLLRARIDLAKRLLGRRGETIESIAEQCGYADRHHFSVRFKASTGTSPAAYRRRLRPESA